MQQVKATKKWTDLPQTQVSNDVVWELTRNYNSFLVRNHGLTLSKDPLNLTGLNTRRDSGLANSRAFGISFGAKEGTVKDKKAKSKASIVRFGLTTRARRFLPTSRAQGGLKGVPTQNNAVYSEQGRITSRAIAKSLNRAYANYRPDLLPLAFKRLRRLHRFKRSNKRANRAALKKEKK